MMRNRYGVLYNNAMEELIQKDLKGNGVLFARSVTQGANGIGFLWGGDNESSFSPENGLPTVVMAGLNAGMSGMPLWTADLGGYLKTATTPDPVVRGAVDGVCGVFADDGDPVAGEYAAVELGCKRRADTGARYLPEVCGAAYEPVSVPVRGGAGGGEDGHADRCGRCRWCIRTMSARGTCRG